MNFHIQCQTHNLYRMLLQNIASKTPKLYSYSESAKLRLLFLQMYLRLRSKSTMDGRRGG